MAVGFRKPAILLPSALVDGGNEARLEPILRHELAHIVRRDDWSNLLQQVIHAIFFFHPGVWWLSSRLTIDREIACDDHVLIAIGGRKEYALLLAEFAKPASGRGGSPLLPPGAVKAS
jgi:beta-lactamase regulating signal transducer with metallopeptidase domain